jgi:hypothetical protein
VSRFLAINIEGKIGELTVRRTSSFNISELVRATTNQLKASTQKCFWYNSMKQNVCQSPLLSIKSPFQKTFTVKIQRYLMTTIDVSQ